MRDQPDPRAEAGRIRTGHFGTPANTGCQGAFACKLITGADCVIIADDGRDWTVEGMPGKPWEHVSVSMPDRCPIWEEMDEIKDMFWRPDEVVLQFHVAKQDHINHHPHCLHLWRQVGVEVPMPPPICVAPGGVKP